MAKVYKNIPVAPDVYKKVSVIAADNFRTLGGQIAYWVENEWEELKLAGKVSDAMLPEPVESEAQ